MAGKRAALAALRARLHDAGGPLDAAGPVGPQHRLLRLRDVAPTGWHTTIFPPYFVAGAIFSGFAMVVTLLVILRKVFKMEDYVTLHHLENMNKIILVTG